jgi:hypothetical protein
MIKVTRSRKNKPEREVEVVVEVQGVIVDEMPDVVESGRGSGRNRLFTCGSSIAYKSDGVNPFL